jgi:Inner membrane protein YgaP-like, transmembrane domain
MTHTSHLSLRRQLTCRPAPVEGAIRIVAGTFVALSLVLAALASPWWLLLAAFVAVNLIQSAFTGFCPAELLLRRIGVGRQASEAR